MDNTKAVVEKAVETETTQTSSPQVEAPITEEKTVQEETVQPSVAEDADVTSSMTEEQRRAFQEMRLENKRLKELSQTQSQGESAFDAFRVQPAQAQQVGPVNVETFRDNITGDINWQAYNYAQQQREQLILSQAKNEARAEVQELLDEQEARAKFPELMSDPKTEKLIAAQWFMESKFAGKPVKITQIAAEFARNFKQAVSKAEKIGAERVLTEVSEKEKAGLVASSQTSQEAVRSSSTEEQEQLSADTRRGNYDAITARISKIPWANK